MSSVTEITALTRRRRRSLVLTFLVVSVLFAVLSCTKLRDFRDRIREQHQLEDLASLDPIDAHTHIGVTSPAFVAMLERLHMHVLDILYVDDTNPDRASLERQKQDALRFIASANGRATLCTTFDPLSLNDNNFPQVAIEALNQDFAQGAIAAKVWKNIGMEIKNGSGQYVMPDDPTIEPIYRDIAEHNKTLIIHAADPDSAWTGVYTTPGGAHYYSAHPQWNMTTKVDAVQKTAILQARDRILERNRDLRVVGAHFGSMESALNELALLLQKYPNFAIDTSGRVQRLAHQPRAEVRNFLLQYQDQVIYGSDLEFQQSSADASTASVWMTHYLLDWRYFATGDTFDYLGQKVEGLELPVAVLKKLYHDNAVRWIPGVVSGSH